MQELFDLGILRLFNQVPILLNIVLLNQLDSQLLRFVQVLFPLALDALELDLCLGHPLFENFHLLLMKLKELCVMLIQLLDELFVFQLSLPFSV